MKLIELHILQSYPVSCLNRDDVGAPKTAIFGGTTRGRISSQCLKRATRLMAAQEDDKHYQGERSRLVVVPLRDQIAKQGISNATAEGVAKIICDEIGVMDSKAEKKGVLKTKTMLMFSPLETEEIAKKAAEIVKENGLGEGEAGEKELDGLRKKLKGAVSSAKKAALKDGADIAIFGRMVASDPSLTLEGAAMFGHSLSTHKHNNDIDYWTAVDDRQADDPTVADEDRAGSGGMGTAEFGSATHYRYVALNLDMLFDDDHLGALDSEDKKSVVKSFLKAALMAVPSGRKNSMNAATLPFSVLGILKDKGQPIQLVNAFEKTVEAGEDGYAERSRKAMKEEHERITKTWGVQEAKSVWMPDIDLNTFVDELTDGI
jgi:CRISPR system Cascade subunit CasC